MLIRFMSFLCVTVSLFLCGCSTTRTMNRIMSSWEGVHINDVVAQWGYPSEQKEFEGRKIYVWNYSKSAYIPQSSTTTGSVYGNVYRGQTNTYGGYAIQGLCVRILEVDNRGYVTRWEWHGNNCPFAERMEYSNWRNKAKD